MILRRAARPMLAAIFISGGIEALRSPQAHARAAKPVLEAVGPAVDQAVEVAPLDLDERPDDEMLVKIDAGVKIVAGTMLAFGKFPRLASTALAASLIPTTLAGHRFWEEDDPEVRAQQQIHFLKNLGLLGGLLIASADTQGRPSIGLAGAEGSGAAVRPDVHARRFGRRAHREARGRGVRRVGAGRRGDAGRRRSGRRARAGGRQPRRRRGRSGRRGGAGRRRSRSAAASVDRWRRTSAVAWAAASARPPAR